MFGNHKKGDKLQAMEVCFQASGNPVAVLDMEDLNSGKAVKQALTATIGVTRFRQRLFWDDGCEIPDDVVFDNVPAKVRLVILEFWPPDEEQNEKMMSAVAIGWFGVVEELLQKPLNPNSVVNILGDTPLNCAAGRGHIELILLLVEANAEINTTSLSGWTPLLNAAYSGRFDAARCLVELQANIDQPRTDDGSTPLHLAAEDGYLDIVRYLVENGANKDERTTDNHTPLHLAVEDGHLEVIRYLLEAGARNDETTGDIDGFTPLHWACQDGNLDLIGVMLEKRANIDQPQTENGLTPLHLAADQGDLELARFLLEAGANRAVATSKTDGGYIPLHTAAYYGHLDMVRLLVEGADPTICDSSGKTALDWAQENNHEDVIQFLSELTRCKARRVGDKWNSCLQWARLKKMQRSTHLKPTSGKHTLKLFF